MNRLQQAWIWLSRIGNCRGFGIQSPSDYRFVRYVVNESWPYYAYAELGGNDCWLRRKLGRLYFRLANFLQPDAIADFVGAWEYCHAGCRKAANAGTAPVGQDKSRRLLIIAPPDVDADQLMDAAGEQTVAVVEGVGKHPKTWKKILADQRVTVAFDLYYCGIVFFDSRRTKQHYVVNF